MWQTKREHKEERSHECKKEQTAHRSVKDIVDTLENRQDFHIQRQNKCPEASGYSGMLYQAT